LRMAEEMETGPISPWRRDRVQVSGVSAGFVGADASEHDVVMSTLDSVKAGGFMREYIELGKLAHVHGNCLYVHGGIVGGGCRPDEHAVGAMPLSEERIEDVHEWVAALHAWKDAQVQDWISNPLWSGDAGTESSQVGGSGKGLTPWRTKDGCILSGGGQALQDYGLFTDGPTVVLGRHLQKTGMPMEVPHAAISILNKGGIRRVVVGHTPHGTCPTIIKTAAPGVEEPGLVVVMADTSYSDMKAADNRGRAVSEVLLLDDGKVRVHGELPDGRGLCYMLPDGIGAVEPPEMVGWSLPPITPGIVSAVGSDVTDMIGEDAYFVKAFLESGSDQTYLLQHVNGFVNKYVYLRPREVTRIFTACDGDAQSAAAAPSEAALPTEPSRSSAQPARHALLTMHSLGDNDGSESYAYALRALVDQMQVSEAREVLTSLLEETNADGSLREASEALELNLHLTELKVPAEHDEATADTTR